MGFDAPGGVGWGEESGDEVLFGAQGVPPETWGCRGLPGAEGVAGGAPTSLFSMLGRDRLGQWVTPSSRVLAGKDRTVMIPQLVPCVVQVGDEAERQGLQSPPLSLLRGPPGCAGEGLADEISNPAGVARGKERGQGLAAGSHSSNSSACLLGVFCASPSQIRRFVPRDVLAVPCRW